MQGKSKYFSLKIILFASVISAVLIALTSTLPSVAANFSSVESKNGSEVNVDVSKTANWLDDTYTKGQVQITAKATGRDPFVPEVLFLGTLCSAHGLSKQTVVNALNAIKQTSNVDYWLCNNAEPSYTGNDKSGTLIKGGPDITLEDMPDMPTSNHQALQKFLKHIYEMNNAKIASTGKAYDFIVLEFDGTRISDWYRNLRPDDDDDPRSPTGDYTKYSNEALTAEMLKTFYKNNQVIWVTDVEVDPSDPGTGYHPSRNMHVRGQYLDTRIINYNSLKALLAPELYVPTQDTPQMTDAQIRQIEAGLSTAPVDDDYVLGPDRQIGYNESAGVGVFLEKAIDSIFNYQIVIKDKIDVEDCLKITQNSVLFEMRDSDADNWEPVPSRLFPKKEINYETGEVTASVANLKGDKQFRLTIGFEDKSTTERFVKTSLDGNPNDGTASATVTPGAGEAKSDVAGTQIPLNWPIEIKYRVEDGLEDEPVAVTRDIDNSYADAAEAEKLGMLPEGSFAEVTSGNEWTFQYWSLEDGYTYVSNDFNFVPEPVDGRYIEHTYIAHFEKRPDCKHLVVSKVWSDGDDFHLNDSINVRLWAKDSGTQEKEIEGHITLSAENRWTYTTNYVYQIFEEDHTTPIQYYFIEDPVEGYTTSYEVDKSSPQTIGNTTITNTYIPGPEPGPSPTPDPGKVDPVGHSPIKTGDISNLFAFVLVAAISGIVLITTSRIRSRKDKERG